jgi:hypothetical protein
MYLDPGKVFLILTVSKFGVMFIFNIAEVYFRTYLDIIKSLLCWTVIYMTILLHLFVIPIKKDVSLLYLKLPPPLVFNVGLINILQTFCVQDITHRTTNSTTE